jgi:type IV secretory pathway TrbF-like protein
MQFMKRFVAERNGSVEDNGTTSPPLFTPNPYLNSRRQWNSQIDRAFADKHVWQSGAAVACLLIALACVQA